MKKKLKYFIIIFIIFLVLLILAYKFKANTTVDSVILEATKDIKTADTIFFFQSDLRWYNDSLGDSEFEMDDSGCLTTSITSALCMEEIEVDGIDEINPKTINKLLSENNVYDSEGNMQWEPLAETLDITVVKKSADEISSSKIDKLLKKGIYPIVRVRVGGVGAIHYVLITESHDGEYWCMDPMNRNEVLVSLSDYGNIVYAMRYIK